MSDEAITSFQSTPFEPLELFIWIDDKFFIKAEILASEMSSTLQEIQEFGVNEHKFKDEFTHFPPHRVSKIDVIRKINE